MKHLERKRIEKEVRVLFAHEYSDKYPNRGEQFMFEDNNGIKYSYDTLSYGSLEKVNVCENEKWLVKMSIVAEDELLRENYKIVERVKIIRKIETN